MFQQRFAFTEAQLMVHLYHLFAVCFVLLNHPKVRIYPELAVNVPLEPVPDVKWTFCLYNHVA